MNFYGLKSRFFLFACLFISFTSHIVTAIQFFTFKWRLLVVLLAMIFFVCLGIEISVIVLVHQSQFVWYQLRRLLSETRPT